MTKNKTIPSGPPELHELQKWFPTPFLTETYMFQLSTNLKITCNMLVQASLLVSVFGLKLLPTGSPLMKLRKF